ncbi:tRNA (adenine(22)-N(1))-methyltransferase [Hutsoniella sourekii]|uniref:tRNA (adenine(22)-N(1))-methyltransferase n=1 Tax=Hutsoniella sourekii TaxID=87650 RepID=UPI0004897BFE|nr:tRNA (adenine(22)-N(1))-methyltransferase TrmK [Hutsoniella sourekii]
MDSNKLSKRLQQVADFVVEFSEKPSRLADIGTDHAYLPVNLMKAGKIDFAVAGDVVEGPYQSACREVANNGLTDKIDVRLASGLQAVEPDDLINVVTICGMGGRLIQEILEEGVDHLTSNHLLVLQPNMAEYQLRDWLDQQGYTIVDEAIIQESRHFYEIIVASSRKLDHQKPLSEEEKFFGPFLLKQKTSRVFQAKWHKEANKIKKIIHSIQESSKQHSRALRTQELELERIQEVLIDD